MATRTLNWLSLCSGVGMLDEGVALGCEHLGARAQTICYVERDAHAAATLVARMAEQTLAPAPIWDDLTTFRGAPWRGLVHGICAGFPCQPWSAAGKGEGTDDERWLWPDIAQIIHAVKPGLVFLENVAGLVSGYGLNYVLDSLAALGFDAEWSHLSAAAVGAAHERDRIFILAYAQHLARRAKRRIGSRRRANQGPRYRPVLRALGVTLADDPGAGSGAISGPAQWGNAAHIEWRDCDVGHAGGNGRSAGNDGLQREATSAQAGIAAYFAQRRGELGNPSCDGQYSHGEQQQQLTSQRRINVGNAAGARQQERIGRRRSQQPTAKRTRGEVADAAIVRRDEGPDKVRPWQSELGSVGIFAPGPSDLDGWDRVVQDGSFRAPAIEPGVRVLADGVALVVDQSRADQLRCAGNGVVPLQAAAAFVELMRRI